MLMSICVDILTLTEEGLAYLGINICQAKAEIGYIQHKIHHTGRKGTSPINT